MTEKLCMYCEKFQWRRIEPMACETCGGLEGGMSCAAGHFYDLRPEDESDFRATLLVAGDCADFDCVFVEDIK